ncbi:MAG: methyltransferase domain-containing protein [Sphingobacteriales bacterium]|nr:MAG: methyltransferase domain-containing protein [Sphingobacteriales bacterium]
MDTVGYAALQTTIVLYQAPLYKRILSYIIPVRIREGSSEDNPSLELFLFRGDYQLATPDAVYSDGRRYRPLVAAFREIKDDFPGVKKVLLLGTGLGSGVEILRGKGYYPEFVLVEKDSTILSWAIELLTLDKRQQAIRTVCADAKDYMDSNSEVFDLVVVDIFNSRVVPEFVTGTDFLKNCRRSMGPGGKLILNYIINNEKEWDGMLARFRSVFASYDIVSFGINRVIIARA